MTEKAHCLPVIIPIIYSIFLRLINPCKKLASFFDLQIPKKPMVGSEPTTFRLQGECSSQAELHWHEVQKDRTV